MNESARKIVASALVLALHASIAPALASLSTASLTGRVVLAADTPAPLPGSRVHVADPATGRVYTSAPSSADGTFHMAALPAATYQVAVESGNRLYVVDNPVALASGQDRAVQLAVNRQAGGEDNDKGDKIGKPAKTGIWNNPLTASLIVAGSAIVVGVIVGNASDDEPTSPFSTN